MIRAVLTIAIPPVAACRYGCASCCAAPIGVFWLTGIVAIIYGLAGGYANLMAPSWDTVSLGIALWIIASVWAAITLRNADDEKCARKKNKFCSPGARSADESDPFEEVRKAR
ncbi:MAG: hypothetical protein RQ736_10835 [Thiogranum sp.]|nr:hypothetical protein [Thiogranum sp.]